MKSFSSWEPGSLLVCIYDPLIYEKGDPDRDYIDEVHFEQMCHAMNGKRAMVQTVEEYLALKQEFDFLLGDDDDDPRWGSGAISEGGM